MSQGASFCFRHNAKQALSLPYPAPAIRLVSVYHGVNSGITLRCWLCCIYHDDVIKWKHFPRYWSFILHQGPAVVIQDQTLTTMVSFLLGWMINIAHQRSSTEMPPHAWWGYSLNRQYFYCVIIKIAYNGYSNHSSIIIYSLYILLCYVIRHISIRVAFFFSVLSIVTLTIVIIG